MYLGDIPSGYFEKVRMPYRELSSAPLRLVAQERRQYGLGSLGDPGFFSTSKKWRRRQAMMMGDVNILKWWGYKFSPEEQIFINNVNFKAAKESAERSGLNKLVRDVALPAAISIASAGALTPLAVGIAAGTATVNAVMVDKATNKAIDSAEKGLAIQNDIIRTEGELEKVQAEIIELQRQSGASQAVVNKVIQDKANQQQQQKKGLATILTVGSALAIAAMAT